MIDLRHGIGCTGRGLSATMLMLVAVGCGDGSSDASGDDTPMTASTTMQGDGDGDASTGDGDGDASAGDGDATTGDGDGDASTGDGDGDGDVCGDGVVTGNETCDDQGESATCDADCTAVACGDGTANGTAGEQCDDGANNGDGTSNCTTVCQFNVCGDGYVGPGEACDDGNATGGDGCSVSCQVESCGNGVVDVGEDCDGSVGTSTCADAGFFGGILGCDQCSFEVSGCTNCGDGVLQAGEGEACDDGGNNGDGISTCTLLCALNVCGDGYDGPGEACDDGNTQDGDSCAADCQTFFNTCGDGIVAGVEFCDVGPTSTCNVCTASDTGTDGSYSFLGEAVEDASGYAVAFAGDVDGDGKDDLLIGAYLSDAGGTDSGTTYLMLSSDVTAQAAGSTFDLGTQASYRFEGGAAGDNSGHSVASAGDVDGDGNDDLLIGAYGADVVNMNQEGVTYLVLSSAVLAQPVGSTFNLATDASYRFEGENVIDGSGYRVAPAGDVDGDGKGDLLIGARRNDEGSDGDLGTSDEGKTYLVFGSAITSSPVGTAISLGSQASYSFVGVASGDLSSDGMWTAGDVDGDGKDDVLIGAYANDAAADNAGATYLMLSSAITASPVGTTFDLGTQASYRFLGEGSSDYSGCSVTLVEDVDGDGKDDVLIGAYGEDSAGVDGGMSYLMLSSVITASAVGATFDLATQASYRFQGASYTDNSGRAVASAGDVDGDGRGDLLIGAPKHDSNGTNSGAVHLMLSSTINASPAGTVFDLGTQASATFVGETAQDELSFKIGVAGGGDADGDGRDDLLVGAPYNDEGSDGDPATEDEGKSYLILSPY